MKKFYRISWDIDNTPAQLFCSIMLALYVMIFINIFVGTLGGIPAFAGFFAVFYLMRGMVAAGNRISHQLALESRTEVRYMFVSYSLIYMVIWLIMKFVLMLSKFTGWGNINRLTIIQYVQNLYGTTMLEKWAYVFSAILMFSFVLSLFPLIVIRKRKHWFWYLAIDSGIFAMICIVISRFSFMFVPRELRSRAKCVLDVMLLCKLPKSWEAALYIISIIIFTLAVGILAYFLAIRFFLPKPGKRTPDKSLLEEIRNPEGVKRKRKRLFVNASVVLTAVVIGVGYFLFAPTKQIDKYKKVAEYLTSDSTLGPMVYKNRIYLPTAQEKDLVENGRALGYLANRGESCDSRFYKLAISNILYAEKNSEDASVLQMEGAQRNFFYTADDIEKAERWRFDSVFLLWDEDWSGETTYGTELTGYSECEVELIESLERKFGRVEYNLEDFKDYDAYFTIRGYSDMKQVVEAEVPYGDWVGCIIIKDNKFYYGNCHNRISGVMLSTLLEVLGGY